MVHKKDKIPEELIRELDINEKEEIVKEFEVYPRVELHQIKLPIPMQLIRDLGLDEKLDNKKKIKLYFDEESNELRYKF